MVQGHIWECITLAALLCSYNPHDYYEKNPELKLAIDQIASGYFSPSQPELFTDISNSLMYNDRYAAYVGILTTCVVYVLQEFICNTNKCWPQ